MYQYLISIRSGRYEDVSVASLNLFFLTEEDKTPTQIANLFRDIVHGYVESQKGDECIFNVRNILGMTNDEFDYELYTLLEENNFYFYPLKGFPIKKIIDLQEMVNYLTDCDCWYFQPENLNNGEVSGEIFNVVWEN